MMTLLQVKRTRSSERTHSKGIHYRERTHSSERTHSNGVRTQLTARMMTLEQVGRERWCVTRKKREPSDPGA